MRNDPSLMWTVLIEAVNIAFDLWFINCSTLVTDNSVWLSFALAKTKTAPKDIIWD